MVLYTLAFKLVHIVELVPHLMCYKFKSMVQISNCNLDIYKWLLSTRQENSASSRNSRVDVMHSGMNLRHTLWQDVQHYAILVTLAIPLLEVLLLGGNHPLLCFTPMATIPYIEYQTTNLLEIGVVIEQCLEPLFSVFKCAFHVASILEDTLVLHPTTSFNEM